MVRAFLNNSVGALWPVVGLGAILCQLPLVARLDSVLGRALPFLGGSTAAAGAAGAMLVVGLSHPASTITHSPALRGGSQSAFGPTRTSPKGPALAPPNASPPPASLPAGLSPPPLLPAPTPAGTPLPTSSSPAHLPSPSPSGAVFPTPTPNLTPLPTPSPQPAPTAQPLPTPPPTPPAEEGPLGQLLRGVTGLLHSLGL